MSEFVAHSEALDHPGVMLQIGFLPLFECQPVLSVSLPASPDNQSPIVDALDRLVLHIDDKITAFEALPDEYEGTILLTLDASLAERQTLRKRLDQAQRAELRAEGGEGVVFSLSGSQSVAQLMETACREYVPEK